MFINKESEKKEQQRALERMAKEDNATIQRYSSMKPQDMTYRYDSKKTIQRNYRDFEIYTSMKTDAAQSYGKFQKSIDFINVSKIRTVPMLLGNTGEGSLEIDKMIKNLCGNRLLDNSVEVNDMRILTEQLLAGSLSDENPNADVCRELKEEGIKALGEVYFRELDALSNKYGLDKLIDMSPLDYIKVLPEIMYDFACIDDMQKFFGKYDSLAVENPQMMQVLNFYTKSWKQLQNRYHLILNGNYKGEECAAYSREMNNAYNEAKRHKLFGNNKKRQPKKLSDMWVVRENRKNMATRAVCTYNEMTEREQDEYDKAERMVKEYCINVEKINRNANAKVISDEEVNARVNEIMSGVTYHMAEVSADNVRDMSEDIFERINDLCTKLANCSDDVLIRDYSTMIVEKEHLDSEITNMIYANFWLDVTASTPHLSIKSNLSKISADYPLFGKIKTIINKRIELIQKYGYTNSNELTDMHDVTEARYNATDKYKNIDDTNKPMSITDALKMPLFKNRLKDLDKIDFKIVTEEIAACRKAFEFRKQQPEFYLLGLSYEDYIRAEAMCELLPYYEKAYELTLQYIGINNIAPGLEDNLKQEWLHALDLYDKKSYRVDNSTTNSTYKADEMGMFVLERDALINKKDMWQKNVDDEVKLMAAQACDFISDGNFETRKSEVAKITIATEYKKQILLDEDNVDFTPQQFDAISDMTFKFFAFTDRLDTEIKASDYAVYKIFELRRDLYKAQREAFYLKQFFDNEKVKDTLIVQCTGSGHADMMKEIYLAMPEAIRKIDMYADYVKGLNLEYAKRNNVKEMTVSIDGAYTTVKAETMSLVARTLKQRNEKEINRLRLEKLKGDNRQSIEKQQMEARIRKAVGHEKIASDTKTFMANLKEAKDLASLGGNVIGAPLQLLSWILHKPRTMHGIINYDECQLKYEEMMQTLGEEHSMRTASLPMWQRGDAGISPEIDLDGLFSSQMKKRIYGLLNNDESRNLLEPAPHDIMDNEFTLAINSIKQYATIVGIVNTDTTEMEMSFLDMFLKKSEKYLSSNSYSEDETIRRRCSLLSIIKADIYNNLKGTLSTTISEEELNQINDKTIAYVESTVYSENMEESNIQDIPLFLHEPNINDVKQSSIGDCWLVSAISAVVRTNPDYIRSMFHDTGDGNVIVRLYGIEKNGKTINSDSSVLKDKDVKTFPTYFKLRKQYETGWGNASDCTWVQLIEKAYALSGFNGRREMAVKGNKLYNVTDELTYGHQGIALMHLTGKQPTHILNSDFIKMNENAYYNTEFIASLFDGFTQRQITRLCGYVFGSAVTGNQMANNDIGYLRDCILFISEDENQRIENFRILNENLQKIKNGIRSDQYENIKRIIDDEKLRYRSVGGVDIGNLDELEVVKVWAEYFEEPRNINYEPEEDLFYRRCKKAFDNGKTLSVAIPHCVDILDAKETEQGKRFILMRDPFNIYNYKYTGTVDNIETTDEGFGHVILGCIKNRKLEGNAQDMIRYGFRGTSWVELKDLYARIRGVYAPEF